MYVPDRGTQNVSERIFVEYREPTFEYCFTKSKTNTSSFFSRLRMSSKHSIGFTKIQNSLFKTPFLADKKLPETLLTVPIGLRRNRCLLRGSRAFERAFWKRGEGVQKCGEVVRRVRSGKTTRMKSLYTNLAKEMLECKRKWKNRKSGLAES